jgi:hypothetical protein
VGKDICKGKRIHVRIDADIKAAFFAKCEKDNFPTSFLLRAHIVKCTDYYKAKKWLKKTMEKMT